ncbi:electron transport protein [Paenibacillus cisolokensis]|uniref:electron transport protein n=1 Tax=Paenibacillus cisolokensis TaxID=1658519 RepID=UPI003D2E0FC8
MRKSRWLWLIVPVLAISAVWLTLYLLEPEYSYTPPIGKLENKPELRSSQHGPVRQFDVWGKSVKLHANSRQPSPSSLSPDDGAVEITPDMLELGRKTLYEQTFGNEIFLSDVLGIVSGPLTIKSISKAIAKLKGAGTSNLEVALEEDITVGGLSFKKGDIIKTGFDVAKGSYMPVGLTVKYQEGRVKVGVTCMACHATVNDETGRLVEGAPNADLNLGLVLALAPNSAAFFTHTDVDNLVQYVKDSSPLIPNSKGGKEALPDARLLEKAVDDNFVKWAPGYFDTTVDLISDITQIPDMFTKGDYPYSWSGFAAIGPFKGLSSFTNNVHAQNTDSLSQMDVSDSFFGIDKEVYVGTILQNAANPKYRYDPKSGMKPSVFFDTLDPNPGTAGANEVIKIPNYPKVSAFAPNGLYVNTPGYKVGEQVNAMSAYQNVIRPPVPKQTPQPETLALGKEIFRKAQCITCHAGDAFNNHRILPVKEIGTEPARARAFFPTENDFGKSLFYPPDTPVPLPKDAKVVEVPSGDVEPDQLTLGLGHKNTGGGYKVKGLIGLRWSAPYLHDGGVAVGPELTQVGVSATLMKGISPDPYNSLKAMVDRNLRELVVKANREDQRLKDTSVTGQGHEYWVDETTGYTKEQQDALIQYLLNLKLK